MFWFDRMVKRIDWNGLVFRSWGIFWVLKRVWWCYVGDFWMVYFDRVFVYLKVLPV